ncbi:cytochrome C oxidase subunit IV family protein [Lutibacter citreus]|uniref:cytochrome C oxidase subunit IV family protein n=1 Tax=Lutibacter citreus TaxID=2138210 RepID=UPI000DBEA9EA|nr:cytochrome C oxidase subunit IV family protein [Lutibacter citreus]
MKNSKFLGVWIALIVLTVISALVSNSSLYYASSIIIILAVVKFIGISFYFMELKKAHIFWKASVLFYLVLFSIIIISFL